MCFYIQVYTTGIIIHTRFGNCKKLGHPLKNFFLRFARFERQRITSAQNEKNRNLKILGGVVLSCKLIKYQWNTNNCGWLVLLWTLSYLSLMIEGKLLFTWQGGLCGKKNWVQVLTCSSRMMTEDHTQNQEHSFFPYELILSGR